MEEAPYFKSKFDVEVNDTIESIKRRIPDGYDVLIRTENSKLYVIDLVRSQTWDDVRAQFISCNVTDPSRAYDPTRSSRRAS